MGGRVEGRFVVVGIMQYLVWGPSNKLEFTPSFPCVSLFTGHVRKYKKGVCE